MQPTIPIKPFFGSRCEGATTRVYTTHWHARKPERASMATACAVRGVQSRFPMPWLTTQGEPLTCAVHLHNHSRRRGWLLRRNSQGRELDGLSEEGSQRTSRGWDVPWRASTSTKVEVLDFHKTSSVQASCRTSQ